MESVAENDRGGMVAQYWALREELPSSVLVGWAG